MPVEQVPGGWRWGKHGKVYPTRAEAERQGQAAYASGFTEKDMENTIKSEVLVHKANIPLLDGESLSMFSAKLRKAAGDELMSKLNLTAKNSYQYMLEVFSNATVFDVCKREGAGPDSPMGPYKYYAVEYARKADGTFTFGNVTEVERVTSYQPKPSLPVAKSLDDEAEVLKALDAIAAEVEKAVWDTAYINNLPDAAFAYVAPGGKKDGQGKTIPRSLRFLPHHGPGVKGGTENTTVDVPHLKAALSRLNQAQIPPAAKASAKAHLMAHAKELLASYKAPAQKAGLTDASTLELCAGGKVSKDCGCSKGVAGCSAKAGKVAKQLVPGWIPTSKAFWGEVL